MSKLTAIEWVTNTVLLGVFAFCLAGCTPEPQTVQGKLSMLDCMGRGGICLDVEGQ